MSAAMDRALMALSLDEDDVPLDLPDLPQFSSMERNSLSLIGRTLNPEAQKMSSLILHLPRKWQKEGKMRGVALSQEKFQFLFDHEHDLVEILEKGAHTHNEWAIAIERWVSIPPDDYLQTIPIWVQIRKLPVNHYTEASIMAIGERLGRVDEVAFDPKVSQTQDCVKVKIRFDVTKPLRRTLKVNLPRGEGQTVVELSYERIQKRCTNCQRLIHNKDKCLLLDQNRQSFEIVRQKKIMEEQLKLSSYIGEEDPLFGVLKESQIGINSSTGRPKIAKEVLDEMRNYLQFANVGDLNVRQERVRQSVLEVEKDPVAHKSLFRLEPATVFTQDISKGKGLVFEFGNDRISQSEGVMDRLGGRLALSHDSSTVLRTVSSEACSSGARVYKRNPRRRPSKAKKGPLPPSMDTIMLGGEKKKGIDMGGAMKRKENLILEKISKAAKCANQEVIPSEGSPDQ